MRKALFVWIPRTAGSSIWVKFARGRPLHARLAPWDKPPDVPIITYQHWRPPDLMALTTFDQKWLDERFLFSFVRNPWERLVSIYHHLRSGYEDQRKAVPMPFADFIERVCSGYLPGIGLGRAQALSYAHPQTAWLDLGQGRQPDFIGRFEDLQADWKALCGLLEFPHSALGKSNESRHQAYQSYYEERQKLMVARSYAEEIERFGYEFA